MNAPQPMTLKKPSAPNVPGSATGAVNRARWLRNALPAISLVVLLVTIFIMQPRAMSYMGMNLISMRSFPPIVSTYFFMVEIFRSLPRYPTNRKIIRYYFPKSWYRY